ncbi:alpha/beta fold hydrolase [Actinomadura oligospora]|uniref:alpha/beta fold hydrolase n=1 Tax=Actinomadura oligospora TaxID=111804 RepID=UPI0004799415|nr:alpha/beta hydrolase [Actinomadura oligospora]
MTATALETPEVDLVYDVQGPLPTADGRPPLFVIGQPMTDEGFRAFASHFGDRTVVTHDPRSPGRSARRDGRTAADPETLAWDVHTIIEALGAGPVEMFAGSGGAVAALALVRSFPDDVTTLVVHEPPLISVLPDADAAGRARAAVKEAFEGGGFIAGLAAFTAMASWQGEFDDAYFAQPAADPAAFGMPSGDDGVRDGLLSDAAWPVTGYAPDFQALIAAPTRMVIGVGEEAGDALTGRSARATAALLGQEVMVFPRYRGGFAGPGTGDSGEPEEFAAKLREVLN